MCLSFQSLQASRRYSPELINFVVGFMYLTIVKEKKRDIRTVHAHLSPFRQVGLASDLLLNKFDQQ